MVCTVYCAGDVTSSSALQTVGSVVTGTLGSNAPLSPSDTTPVDASLPHISLLGNGTRFVDVTGHSIILDNVGFASTWVDPGATALDLNAYGIMVDLTSNLQSFGVGGVNTSIATNPAAVFGFSVEYHVSGGNVWWLVLGVAVFCYIDIQLECWVSHPDNTSKLPCLINKLRHTTAFWCLTFSD